MCAQHAKLEGTSCKAAAVFEKCATQYSGTSLVHFSANCENKCHPGNTHNISFLSVFMVEVPLREVLPFPKAGRACVSLHGGSHLVSHIRFFELNCQSSTAKVFLGSTEFVQKALFRCQYTLLTCEETSCILGIALLQVICTIVHGCNGTAS